MAAEVEDVEEFVVPEDLAQAFEELSQKYAEEIAKECTTHAYVAIRVEHAARSPSPAASSRLQLQT